MQKINEEKNERKHSIFFSELTLPAWKIVKEQINKELTNENKNKISKKKRKRKSHFCGLSFDCLFEHYNACLNFLRKWHSPRVHACLCIYRHPNIRIEKPCIHLLEKEENFWCSCRTHFSLFMFSLLSPLRHLIWK